jgi:glycosyltransferase involved in cell wall biosynthesis
VTYDDSNGLVPDNKTVNDDLSECATKGLLERRLHQLVLISSAERNRHRRVIYFNTYGGVGTWTRVKNGDMPSHHLWGCLQLAQRGYEVLLAEPLLDFYLNTRALPHDLKLFHLIRSWLGSDGIIFCGHNVLYWLLWLKQLGVLKCHIVSNLWAREPLNLASAHSGILALTRAGAEQAARLAPKVKVAPIGWGADLNIYPTVPYRPDTFLSCGIALRDFHTMSLAAERCRYQLDVLVPGAIDEVNWPTNVNVIDSGKGWNFEKKRLSYHELLNNYYARSAASLVIVRKDPSEYIACGFTESIEAMAMARPVIMTKTGALPTEIDVEKKGCGIFVPPDNPDALAEAINYLGDNPQKAEEMGRKGRELAESYYNIERYASDLHEFFERL